LAAFCQGPRAGHVSGPRLTRTATGMLVAIALALPTAATARPVDYAGDPLTISKASPRPAVTGTVQDRFDWASAAIGAGAASVFVLVTGGVARRREHHAGHIQAS
jgi:hypothetical protein